MNGEKLWTKDSEEDFFCKSLRSFAPPEQLFYVSDDGKYYAYWPKNYKGTKVTLQSRNALIGAFTEKWCTDLLQPLAEQVSGYAVQGLICHEIGLTDKSPADVALCKTKKKIQRAKDILLIIEVKMSVVWNWRLLQIGNKFELSCIGDYTTHQGNPGLLRSDTVLKAIGKIINIRVSGLEASHIPIVILGNTPITKTYYEKVDHLKKSGIIQAFWSVNPKPSDNANANIKKTPYEGFYRFDSFSELKDKSLSVLKQEHRFFSCMKSKRELGRIIEIANTATTYEEKAKKFLELIHSPGEGTHGTP